MVACANCSRAIGALETPLAWKNAIVCFECHQRLSAQAAAGDGGKPQPPIQESVQANTRNDLAAVALAARPPQRLALRRSSVRRNGSPAVGCVVAAIVATIVCGLGIVALWLAGVFGSGTAGLTYREFMDKAGLRTSGSFIETSRKDFVAKMGEPDKIQHVGDRVLLYYRVSDGQLQISVEKYGWEYNGDSKYLTVGRSNCNLY